MYKIHVVRFADDFIVTASDKESLLDIKEMIGAFMGQRGLKLSEEKTVITHINDGFDFLGWNFRNLKGKLIIKPSHKSMSKITKKLSGIVKENHASRQETLIRKLNEVIVGWAIILHVQRIVLILWITVSGKCYGNGRNVVIPINAKAGLPINTGRIIRAGSGHS